VENVGEFRLINMKVRNRIIDELIPGEDIRFNLQLMKFKTSYVKYKPKSRIYGTTKYGLGKMILLASRSIISATRRPLIQISISGIVFCTVLSIYCLYALLQQFQNQSIPGWTSLIILLAFGFIFVLLALIVIGLYIAELIRINRYILKRIKTTS
jgi:dolichol-phosphate mannosyltransferase